MRVASQTISNSVVSQIQSLATRQAKLQNQVSSGQRISQPEDDPAAFGRVLASDSEQQKVAQFQLNATRALQLSQASYGGLQSIKDISDRAGELATLGADAISPEASQAYGQEVNQLIEQAIQQGNSKLGNDYLYAGTKVDTPPVSVTRDASGNVTGVSYAGNASQVQIQLSDTSSLAPGTDGTTNNNIVSFVSNLISLRDALNSGSATAVNAVQPNLTTSENALVNSLSANGAVQLRIEVAQNSLTTTSTGLTQLISSDVDADMATTVVKLSQTSTAYQAALSSASKILQMSLMDYLH